MVELVADTHAPEVIRQGAAAGATGMSSFAPANQLPLERVRSLTSLHTGPRRIVWPGWKREMGVQVMRQLEDLLIDRATVTALTAKWRMKAEGVKQFVQDGLARLAVAYGLSPAVDSPA